MPHSQDHFDFEALLAGLPDAEDELFFAIDALEARDERELALQMLELALKHCSSGTLRKQLAERYLHRRNYTRAQELLVEQTLDDPDDANGLLLLARAYSGLGQIERAKENLQRAHACGVAQDRILFWADKLNIPAERKRPQTHANTRDNAENAYAPTAIEESTDISRIDSTPDTANDSSNKTGSVQEPNAHPSPPSDAASIHFGRLSGEFDFDDIAAPNEETGIHFALRPDEDNAKTNAAPTDKAVVHFGPLPGEGTDPEIASPTEATRVHLALLPGDADPDMTVDMTADFDEETSIHFGFLSDDADPDMTSDMTADFDEETSIHFGYLSDDEPFSSPAIRQSGAHPAIRQSGAHPAIRQSGAHPAIRQSQSFQQPPGLQKLPEQSISTIADDLELQFIGYDDEPQDSPASPIAASFAPDFSTGPAATPKNQSGPKHPALNTSLAPKPQTQRSPTEKPVSTPQPIGRGTKVLRNLTQIKLGKSRFGAARLALLTLVVITMFSLIAITVINNNELKRLRNLQAQANASALTDTYADHLRALALLQQASQPPIYLGGLIGHRMVEKLTLARFNPDQIRPSIHARLALVSARIEYRFESSGTRNANIALTNAAASEDTPNADHTIAEIYLALTSRQLRRAQTLINNTSKNYQLNEPLRAVVGHALLDANPAPNDPELQAFVNTLNKLLHPTNHDRLLLAKMHLLNKDVDAATEHLEALENTNQDHISSRLELAKIYLKNDTARARSILSAIIDSPRKKSISPYEKAQAYNLLGQTFATDIGKAEDHFKLAIDAMPRRASIYKPLLELYLTNFKFDDARTLLAQAQAANETSEYIALMRAELLLNNGMAAHSLQLLDARMTSEFPPVEQPARFQWLRGLSFLQLEQPDNAMEAFQLAAKDNTNRLSANATTAATAFALYAGALSNHSNISASQTAIQKLSENVDQPNQDAADIHRANGLIQLLAARHTSARATAVSHARAALTSFQTALTLRNNDSMLLFDICQTDIFLQTKSPKSCDDALAVNTQFLPGMLAVAQRNISQNNFNKAREILLDLRTRQPLNPQIALMLARIFIELKDIDKASAELNSLLGKPAQKSAEWDILEGRIALSKSEYTRALGYFERAHNQTAKSTEQQAEITLYLSQTLTMLGHTERAEQLRP